MKENGLVASSLVIRVGAVVFSGTLGHAAAGADVAVSASAGLKVGVDEGKGAGV